MKVDAANLGNSSHLSPEVLAALQPVKDGPAAPGYTIPCLKQLEFAAGVLLYELLCGKGHPFGKYPANINKLVDPASPVLRTFRREMDAQFGQLPASGFKPSQQTALRGVIHGLTHMDPYHRMPLIEAIRILGGVDKTKNPKVPKVPNLIGEGGSEKSDPSATDRVLEVWILGASYVGKSLLMSAFTGASYRPVTVGVNSGWRNVRPGMPKGFQVRVWDTAGQRIFRNSMAQLTSHDAFVVLVYDVTVRVSLSWSLVFAFVEHLSLHYCSQGQPLQKLERFTPSSKNADAWPSRFTRCQFVNSVSSSSSFFAGCSCVVVANKIDLVDERKVSYSEGLELVSDFLSSCVTGACHILVCASWSLTPRVLTGN